MRERDRERGRERDRERVRERERRDGEYDTETERNMEICQRWQEERGIGERDDARLCINIHSRHTCDG